MKKFYIESKTLSRSIGRDKQYLYNKDIGNLINNIRLDKNKEYPDLVKVIDEDEESLIFISEDYLSYLITPTVDLPELKKFIEKLDKELLQSLKNDVVTYEQLEKDFRNVTLIDDPKETKNDKEVKLKNTKKNNELSMEEIDDQVKAASKAIMENSEFGNSPNSNLSTPDIPKATVSTKETEKIVDYTDLNNPFSSKVIEGTTKLLYTENLPPTSNKILKNPSMVNKENDPIKQNDINEKEEIKNLISIYNNNITDELKHSNFVLIKNIAKKIVYLSKVIINSSK